MTYKVWTTTFEHSSTHPTAGISAMNPSILLVTYLYGFLGPRNRCWVAQIRPLPHLPLPGLGIPPSQGMAGNFEGRNAVWALGSCLYLSSACRFLICVCTCGSNPSFSEVNAEFGPWRLDDFWPNAGFKQIFPHPFWLITISKWLSTIDFIQPRLTIISRDDGLVRPWMETSLYSEHLSKKTSLWLMVVNSSW